MRRASSNVTINSTASQSQIFTDRDVLNVSNDISKGKTAKRPKIFGNNSRGILITKNPPMNSKSTTLPPTPGTPTSISQTPPKTPSSANSLESTVLMNSTDSAASAPTTSSTNSTTRRNPRSSGDQTLQVQARTPQIQVKPDRRKDIKITNCQEKDGIWTATGQFGRESRHSKRAEITYDKKKFRFIQKDDQGNKHVFEIPVSDIEGKRVYFFLRLFDIEEELTAIGRIFDAEKESFIFNGMPLYVYVFLLGLYESVSRLTNKRLLLSTCTSMCFISFIDIE